MVCDTPPFQDAFTHAILNSYLKRYRRYAPDSMQFLETRSEFKFKVTVTQLWYRTLRHPKMHPHTKFEIPTSNNIRDMLRTKLFEKLGQRSRSQWPENVCDTSPSHDAFTHQIWNSYLKEYKRYAPYTIILKTRSEVKVTVTRKWYMTLCHPNMHLHTKFRIPISKNIWICTRLNAVSSN